MKLNENNKFKLFIMPSANDLISPHLLVKLNSNKESVQKAIEHLLATQTTNQWFLEKEYNLITDSYLLSFYQLHLTNDEKHISYEIVHQILKSSRTLYEFRFLIDQLKNKHSKKDPIYRIAIHYLESISSLDP